MVDDSTNTLLYIATYVFIFIIATSISIALFLNVNKYADSAFEYSQGLNSSIINTGSTGTEIAQTGQVPLTRDDVFSYYVNYVKKDLYGEGVLNTNQDVIYQVSINDPESSEGTLANNLTYNELYEKLSKKENYYLEYQEEYYDENNKKYIDIRILYK